MERLPGWGPAPCSPTPSTDLLSLALCLLLLRAPPFVLAVPSCKEEEFPTGAVCCPKCRPGYRVREACGEFAGTVCAPCTPGTFTAHLNGLRECLPCRVCDPGLGQVTRRNCSSTANTVCGCGRGHFCVREDRDACVQCRPHSACRPGQSVREAGSEGQDTWCEDCPPSTFSAGGTQPACTPWTKCSGLLDTVEKPGTNSSDVTCSHRVPVISLVVTTTALIFLLVAIALGLRHRRKLCGEFAFPPGLQPGPPAGTGERAERTPQWDLQAGRVQPDVTTEPVEETVAMFPQRGPPADTWLRVCRQMLHPLSQTSQGSTASLRGARASSPTAAVETISQRLADLQQLRGLLIEEMEKRHRWLEKVLVPPFKRPEVALVMAMKTTQTTQGTKRLTSSGELPVFCKVLSSPRNVNIHQQQKKRSFCS